MMGVNKVTLVGNLGADPEVKKTSSQQTVTVFNLATSRSWVNKEGQRQEHTEWHRIVVWGKLAETCGEYLAKGRQVYIEGRLQTRSWEDDKGQKKYTTEVVAQQVLFLGNNNSTEKRNQESNSYQPEPPFGGDNASSTPKEGGEIPF